jgi:hypothetical protein
VCEMFAVSGCEPPGMSLPMQRRCSGSESRPVPRQARTPSPPRRSKSQKRRFNRHSGLGNSAVTHVLGRRLHTQPAQRSDNALDVAPHHRPG